MSGFRHLFRLSFDLFTGPGFGTGVLVLAGVFLWSGVAKWRQPILAALAMSDFGLTQHPRRAYGVGLAIGELLLSCALVVSAVEGSRGIRGPVLAVVALCLWLFVRLIARSLRRGRTFACFCFGDSDSRLSSRTLLRTGGLALLASILAIAAFTGVEPVSGPRVVLLQSQIAAALLMGIALVTRLHRLGRRDRTSLSLEVSPQ